MIYLAKNEGVESEAGDNLQSAPRNVTQEKRWCLDGPAGRQYYACSHFHATINCSTVREWKDARIEARSDWVGAELCTRGVCMYASERILRLAVQQLPSGAGISRVGDE